MKELRFLKHFALACICTITCASFLTAQDNPRFQEIESETAIELNRVEIESSMTKDDKKALQEARSQEAEDIKTIIAGDDAPEMPFDTKLKSRSLGHSHYYNSVQHWMTEGSTKGDMITIENGAVWKVADGDAYELKRWLKDSPITIYPNHSWFSSYDYTIYNNLRESSINANLSLGPFLHSPYTRKIIDIYPSIGEVLLDDGSIWKCSTSQANMSLFNTWKRNHYIIVGTNDSWFSFGYDQILINTNKDHYVAAKRLH